MIASTGAPAPRRNTGLRLPDGWHPLDDGRPVAVLPDPRGGPPAGVLTVVRSRDGWDAVDAGVVIAELQGQLSDSTVDLMTLDQGPVRCRRSMTAQRWLLVHTQGQRSVTTEVWCFPGRLPAVVCAAIDTGRYAEQQPALHRALHGFRP